MLPRDKHTSLFIKSVIYRRKKVYNIGPGTGFIILYPSIFSLLPEVGLEPLDLGMIRQGERWWHNGKTMAADELNGNY
jgi:hypothetical protein